MTGMPFVEDQLCSSCTYAGPPPTWLSALDEKASILHANSLLLNLMLYLNSSRFGENLHCSAQLHA